MRNFWILVDAKNRVQQYLAGGYAQACHGKSHPLRRMHVGDGLIYYSPKMEYGGEVICQRFTAIGCVIGDIYQVEVDERFKPYRREVRYLDSRDLPIAPLVSRLEFIKDKERWGGVFKYDVLHISQEDFDLITQAMNVMPRVRA